MAKLKDCHMMNCQILLIKKNKNGSYFVFNETERNNRLRMLNLEEQKVSFLFLHGFH